MHGWLALSAIEKEQYLQALSDATGRTTFVLEKDIWVVDVLSALFDSEFARHLAFKGGTSLSKGFKIIDRFSEDIDIAWDMSSLVEIPPRFDSGSFMESYGVKADARVVNILKQEVLPVLEKLYPECELEIVGKTIHLKYPMVAKGADLKRAAVLLEFDARSSASPIEERVIAPYAAELPGFLLWKEFQVPCYPPEYTFWEKICAIYRFTTLNNLTWQLARHWCDVVDIWDHIGREKVLAALVAKEVITHSAVRKFENVNSREIRTSGISLLYDRSSGSRELIAAIEETNRQGYFLEPRDALLDLKKLEQLQEVLNEFLHNSVSRLL